MTGPNQAVLCPGEGDSGQLSPAFFDTSFPHVLWSFELTNASPFGDCGKYCAFLSPQSPSLASQRRSTNRLLPWITTFSGLETSRKFYWKMMSISREFFCQKKKRTKKIKEQNNWSLLGDG